jgi:hypothetical protein
MRDAATGWLRAWSMQNSCMDRVCSMAAWLLVHSLENESRAARTAQQTSTRYGTRRVIWLTFTEGSAAGIAESQIMLDTILAHAGG